MVDVEVAFVAVVGAVAGLGVAKPAGLHAFLDSEVDDCLVLTVVDAGDAREFALAVDHLQAVDHVDGQIARGHRRIIAEEFLAVDKYLSNSLAVGRNGAIGADLHARQALEQVLDHGIGTSLVGIGVELHGILLDGYRSLDADDRGFLEHYGAFRKGNIAEGDILVGHAHIIILSLETHIGGFDNVSALLADGEREVTVGIGDGTLHNRRILRSQQPHRGRDKRLARGIDDAAGDVGSGAIQRAEQRDDDGESDAGHCLS